MSAQKFHSTEEQQAAILRLAEVDLVQLREARCAEAAGEEPTCSDAVRVYHMLGVLGGG